MTRYRLERPPVKGAGWRRCWVDGARLVFVGGVVDQRVLGDEDEARA